MSTTLTPLPGDPGSLKTYATRYETVSDKIAAVARSLDALVDSESSKGDAIEALRENARTSARGIRKAQPRYHETALALVEYAVDLADAQAKANSAIAAAGDGSSDLSSLNHQRRDKEQDRLDGLMSGLDADSMDRIQRDIRRLDNEIDSAEYAISNATATYNKAVQDRDDAVNQAIARIVPVLDELNDTLVDKVADAIDKIANFVAAVTRWIAEIFAAIITAIVVLVAAIIALIVLAILIVVAIALLLIVIQIIQILVHIVLVAALILVIAAIVALVIRSISRELTTPTPEMTRRTDVDQADYQRRAEEGNYENIFNNQNKIDSLGGADETDIEIVTIRDEAGNIIGYRVVLPSTQDWEEANGLPQGTGWDPTGDKGALNDLGSNVALMTMPMGTYGPYERAVQEALAAQMRADGADPKTPVMLCGFSQGGILAARMAADPHSPFNITAVVTAGSCIDSFDIPATTSVLALQHPEDPVPWLDLNPGQSPAASPLTYLNPFEYHATVTAPTEPGQPAHGSVSYAETAAKYLDGSTNPAVVRIQEQQSMFFTDYESVNIYSGHE